MNAPQDDRRVAVIIEDDADIRNLLEAVLRQAGFEAIATSNGLDGVNAVRAFDPIVTTLDVSMPGMDGFETAKRIRAFSSTYLVMLTARDDEIDTLQGLEAGADDYVTKPFRPRELRARIEAMLRRPRHTVPDGPSPVAGAAAMTTAATVAPTAAEKPAAIERIDAEPEVAVPELPVPDSAPFAVPAGVSVDALFVASVAVGASTVGTAVLDDVEHEIAEPENAELEAADAGAESAGAAATAAGTTATATSAGATAAAAGTTAAATAAADTGAMGWIAPTFWEQPAPAHVVAALPAPLPLPAPLAPAGPVELPASLNLPAPVAPPIASEIPLPNAVAPASQPLLGRFTRRAGDALRHGNRRASDSTPASDDAAAATAAATATATAEPNGASAPSATPAPPHSAPTISAPTISAPTNPASTNPAPTISGAASVAAVSPDGEGWLSHNGLRLNPSMRLANLGTTRLDLTRTEFDLLEALLESNRRVRSKADLALLLRGESYVTAYYVNEADKRAVEVHMGNLRRKLGDSIATPRWLETVRGVGYRLAAAQEE